MMACSESLDFSAGVDVELGTMNDRTEWRELSFEFFEACPCLLDPLMCVGGILLSIKIFSKHFYRFLALTLLCQRFAERIVTDCVILSLGHQGSVLLNRAVQIAFGL